MLTFACLLAGFQATALAQSATISSIKPTQTATGQAPAKVVIKGSNFAASSTVLFNDIVVPAKIKAQKIVIKPLPANVVTTSRIFSVTVKAPNGQVSNSIQFVVGSLNTIRLVEPTGSPLVNTKNSIRLRAMVVDRNQNPVSGATITFQSLNPDKATVDSSGQVTGVSSGAATIQLTSGDASLQVNVTVNEVVSMVSSNIFGDGDLKVDPKTGMVYASDLQKHVIKSRLIAQPLNDLAGSNGQAGDVDGSFPASRFNGPLGLGLGNQQLLLADTANQAIRRLNLSSGRVDTIIQQSDVAAAGAPNWSPRGIIQVSDDMYITDGLNHVIWRARLNGTQVSMQILAGGLGQAGLLDGTGISARFNTPQEITLGSGNILVITDRANKAVRLIGLPSGIVSTLSQNAPGLTEPGRFVPNAPQPFDDPKGISSDANGNIYVTDGDSVSVISLAGSTVSTFADVGQTGTFKNAVAVSVAGNSVFVLDAGTGQVLQLSLAAPTITSITPTQINVGQPVEVTVNGANFIPETQVRIGSTPVTGVVVDSASRLRFTLPAQTATGTLTIVLQHYGGSAEARIVVVDPSITVPVKIGFAPSPTTVAPGGRTTVAVNFEVGLAQGQQPGTVTVDIPLNADLFDLANATATPGTLIGTDLYNPGDLLIAPLANGGIRLILSSSKDPSKAKLKGGQGTFCTLTLPVLTNAPAGPQKLDVSNVFPFRTQFNQSLADGSRSIPFVSQPTTVTVSR